MTAPVIANHKGYCLEVKAGRRYLWCSCGRSSNQPFCDGSHKGTDFLPVAFVADKDEDVIFCGCKHTADRPFCDGTHSNLPGGYRNDDPDSAAAERGIQSGDIILDAGGKSVTRPEQIVEAFTTAKADGRKAVLLRVKSDQTVRFVALPTRAAS